MYVEISPADRTVTLQDPRAFDRFSARVPSGVEHAEIDRLLQAHDTGRIDGDEVLVNVAWLKSQAPDDSSWTAGFEAMLAYADSKGWVSAGGTAIRAHIDTGTTP
jgi:hypothetical protein